LDDPEVDGRVKAQPALVGPERAVEADAKPAIDVHFAAVVLPRHAENDLPLRLAEPLDDLVLGVPRILAQHRRERLGDFGNRLVKLRFAGIPALDVADDSLDSCFHFAARSL